ncbi:MAG: hypothetical protein FJ225_06520 [Lentisphaerae bacterium]|nr:hypothetical protein [Lentisphaerota bacterium]
MTSDTTREFRRRLAALPPDVRAYAKRVYARWRKDPWHSSLQFKSSRISALALRRRIGDNAGEGQRHERAQECSSAGLAGRRACLSCLCRGRAPGGVQGIPGGAETPHDRHSAVGVPPDGHPGRH